MSNRIVHSYGIGEHRTVEVYPLGMGNRLGSFCIQGHWCSRRLWRVVVYIGQWTYDSSPIDGRHLSRLGDTDWADD
jgi:hypothetical protein